MGRNRLAFSGSSLFVVFATLCCAGEIEDKPGAVRLTLPPKLYAVVGVETNVYFDNVVLVINPKNYEFCVKCGFGTQQSERWTFVPKKRDVGEYPFILEVRNQQNRVIAKAASTLAVVGADAGAERKVSMLMIGDSLTHASVYPKRVLDLCKLEGNPGVRLIGTNRSKDNAVCHEGYPGWTAVRFAAKYSVEKHSKKGGSPFVYLGKDGSKKLDFARYCQEFNEGEVPDIVTCFLGANDIAYAEEDSIEKVIDRMIKHLDMLVSMVRVVSQETIIGIMLPVPPAGSQDAFGASYNTRLTRWQYKRNQHRLVERLLQSYSNRDKENIFVVPTEVNLDCIYNYPMKKMKRNAHVSASVWRLANGIHPGIGGYGQIGDSLYAWLKYRLK